MTNTEILLTCLLIAFGCVVIVVFRGRRWVGALGWTMVAIAFIVSILNINNGSYLSLTVRIAIALVGMAMASYDYINYERPKRQKRKQAQSLLEGPPAIRRRRQFRIRGRGKRHDRKERS